MFNINYDIIIETLSTYYDNSLMEILVNQEYSIFSFRNSQNNDTLFLVNRQITSNLLFYTRKLKIMVKDSNSIRLMKIKLEIYYFKPMFFQYHKSLLKIIQYNSFIMFIFFQIIEYYLFECHI